MNDIVKKADLMKWPEPSEEEHKANEEAVRLDTLQKKLEESETARRELEQRWITPNRRSMPDEASSTTHKVTIGGQNIYITAVDYDDGTLGKVLIYIGKMGHEESVYKATADTLSIGLQYGVPLEAFVEEYKIHKMGLICGDTSNPEIPKAHSVVDYLGKWLELKYITKGDVQ